jgi:hypothetical protein
MKKLILSLIVMAFASTAAFAQSTQDITASAIVIAQISFADVVPVDFGTFQTSGDAYLAPTGDGTASTNTTGGNLGSVNVTGEGDAQISWTNGTLRKTEGTEELTFVPTITDGTTVLESGTSTLSLSGTEITLSIGGALSGVEAAGTGSFSTTNSGGSPVVITLQYN